MPMTAAGANTPIRNVPVAPPMPCAPNTSSESVTPATSCAPLDIRSECVGIGLAGSDPERVLERHDEDFSIADLPGLGGRADGFDHFAGAVARDRDIDAQ